MRIASPPCAERPIGRKRVTVDPDKVRVRVERGDVVSLLEIDIEIPTAVKPHPANAQDGGSY